MYVVLTDDNDNNTKVLYKLRKDGTKVEQARTVKTIDGKLLMFPSSKLNSLTFKCIDVLKLQLIAGQYIASVKHDIQVYIKPHYQELHRVIMTENYNRYSFASVKYRQEQAIDNIELDDKAILENMLEFIGEL